MATFDYSSCGAPLPDGTDVLCAKCSYEAAELLCAFACDRPAVGVVPTTNPDESMRRRPICEQHVKELLPEESEGFRVVQMFGALHPDYQTKD